MSKAAAKNTKEKTTQRTTSSETFLVLKLSGVILMALGLVIFMAVDLQLKGDIYAGLRTVCYGLSGALAVLLPAVLIWGGILLLGADKAERHIKPFLLALVLFVLVSGIIEMTVYTGNPRRMLLDYMQVRQGRRLAFGEFISQAYSWNARYGYAGGGAVGLIACWPFWQLLGGTPAIVILVVASLVDAGFLLKIKPRSIAEKLKAWQEKRRRRAEEKAAEKSIHQDIAAGQQPVNAAAPAGGGQAPYDAKPRPATNPQNVQKDWTEFAPPRNDPDITARPGPAPRPTAQTMPPRKGKPPVGAGDQGYGFPAPKEELQDPYRGAPQKGNGSVPQQGSGRGGLFRRFFRSSKPAEMHIDYDGTGGGYPADQPVNQPVYQPVSQPVNPPVSQPIDQYRRPADGQNAPGQRTNGNTYSVPNAPAEMPSDTQPMSPVGRGTSSRPITGNKGRRPAGTAGGDDWEDPRKPQPAPPASGPVQPKSSWYDEDEGAGEVPAPAAFGRRDVRVPVTQGKTPTYVTGLDIKAPQDDKETYGEERARHRVSAPRSDYVKPGIELLREPQERTDISPEEDAARSRKLEETLASFRLDTQVETVTHGPAISRFELRLGQGINVSKVTSLADNIAMNMEAKSLRIEAPIPGKALIGIEIPNRTRSTVTFKEVLESPEMQNAKSPITVALGKDIAGEPVICNLSKMPHLLIAGATGSGKSVCINTIINSLLYRYSPHDVRLILIDPKVVELQTYNGVPHLLTPVVSVPQKAASVLGWVVAEMMDRYNRFEKAKVRAIDGYNDSIKDPDDYMPRIVVIIDELADLMMTCKKDVEDHICRIAQLARAAGIHLVVATQRPSVNVITGLIKANIPSRIAFKTTSFVDSRTILDRIGAEQLLGWGDMLYAPTGSDTPMRVQGCFLSDEEVNSITEDIIRKNPQVQYDDSIEAYINEQQQDSSGPANSEGGEPVGAGTDSTILQQAIEMAIRDGEVSTSLLQRRLQLGYSRAGRIVDKMEKLGVVSAKDGTKPRLTLITREDFENMLADGKLDEMN